MPNAIYRMPHAPSVVPNFPYLVVSENLDAREYADIFAVANFQKSKELLKRRVKKGIGIEFLVSTARKLGGEGVAKWLMDIKEAHEFCHSSGCQLIISSGAMDPSEMISGRCIDEIISEIGIDPQKYWKNLESWLQARLAEKVMRK
jgi:hypothetical protein